MDIPMIKQHADGMFRYAINNDYRIVYPTAEFYKEGINNPSNALLILQDRVRKGTTERVMEAYDSFQKGDKEAFKSFMNAQAEAGLNMSKADSHDLVKPLKEAFSNKMKELYPKTGPMRLAIIDKGVVVYDKNLPVVRGLKKFNLIRLIKKYTARIV